MKVSCFSGLERGLEVKKLNILDRIGSLVVAVAMVFFVSCTENTGSIGIPPVNETLETSMAVCDVYTKSVKLDSIKAHSVSSYLGSIYDPETNGRLTGNFITQFAVMEGFRYFPPIDSITSRDSEGRPRCDSVMLQLNFDAYYGDVNTPLKLAVYPLDMNNPLSEDSVYYTNTDLRKYIRPGYEDKPIATKVFTAWDRIHGSDPSNATSGSYPSIRIPLPLSEGNQIMDKYWEYLEDNKGLSEEEHVNRNFDDSYHFIRNVHPGYYAEIINGEGVMVRVFVDALYLIYNARVLNDSIVEEVPSYSVFAGTPEVIQSCQFSESDVAELVEDESCTWLKTPTGICTEVTLPIDDIFSGSHKNDSISRVELMFNRYNKEQTGNQFGIPQNLLLVRKSEANSFFIQNKTPDEVTSYLAAFQKAYNTYTFNNISQMATFMYKDRENAVMAYIRDVLKVDNPTEAQIEEETHEWTKRNPDWNKCCLIPVEITTNTASGSITSVSHDLSLTSARLVKGTKDEPIRIQVYYTRVASASNNE